MTRTVFLPGAAGRRAFWQPVCEHLRLTDSPVLIGWPGFGDEPRDASIHDLQGLERFALRHIEGRFNIVAQSMGGVVALGLALKEPERVEKLVLYGTSGGVSYEGIPHEDWRFAMARATPQWFVDDRTDLTPRLHEIQAPTQLIWGTEDRIAPPEAGKRLASLLPNSRLELIEGAGHDGPVTHAAEVAALIEPFLASETVHNKRA